MALLMDQGRSVLPQRSAKAREYGELSREKRTRAHWTFPSNWPEPIHFGWPHRTKWSDLSFACNPLTAPGFPTCKKDWNYNPGEFAPKGFPGEGKGRDSLEEGKGRVPQGGAGGFPPIMAAMARRRLVHTYLVPNEFRQVV